MSTAVATIDTSKVIGLDAAEPSRRRSTRPIVRIHLLGPMRATTCLGDDVLPRGKNARALLAYLCLAAGEEIPRARLAALLCNDLPAGQAQARFRRALSELMAAFGPVAHELMFVRRRTLKLNLNACWVDALAALAPAPSATNALPSELAVLCHGKLLDGMDNIGASFDQWLAGERARFAQRMRSLLDDEFRQPTRTGADPRQLTAPALSTNGSGRLRIGVLPFLADDFGNKENLAFSLSQEIAAGLARFRWFDVIAPGSPRRRQPAGLIGAHRYEPGDFDYVVDGAVSGGGKHFKISVRLLDLAGHVRPVWSDHFDIALGELYRLDELVTVRIVARIDPVILHIEGQPKRRTHYGATGLLLLAIPMIFSMERKQYEEAGRLIADALMLEPDNAMVEAWAAYWHLFYVGQGWARDNDEVHATIQRHALRAIALDPDNAEALGICAHMYSIVNKNFDAALHYFDRSLRLNPSLAFIWALSAMTYCYIGEPDIALQRLERSRELAPLDPYLSWFQTFYTIAYMFKGDYERAVLIGRRAVKANADFVAGYKPLVASLGHLERRDEAQPYVRKLLSLDPTFTVERFGEVYPIKKASDRTRYMAGLRLAGVPER
jgi:TolB-like protein